jgi:iron complex outermembrane receptor protein
MRPIINSMRAMLVSGVSVAALMGVAAQAQTNTAVGTTGTAPRTTGVAAASAGAVNAGSNSGSGIDDIIVTAQRTSQSLQDVPIAVSAFTAEALEKQQINNASDLQLTLPNITFTKSNFTGGVFTIRGVGDLCVGVTCDAATAIHVNDLPLFGTRIFETEFFDLERVEVLRGPQGTLFGRNATAGVVNFITAKPDLKAMHAAVEGEYGNFDSYKIKAMVNVPLTDTLGVRVAGTYLKRGGFTKNLYNDSDIDGRDLYSIRGSVRWQPTDDTTVDLMGYYFRENDDRLRIQKQLCQRDPTGVLGCTPGGLPNQTVNGNAALSSVFTSTELIAISTAPFRTSAAGNALANALVSLSSGSLYGPDGYANAINPADPRSVYTAFTPKYFADEIQASAQITHDFGAIKVKVSGLYQKDRVDSQQDYNLAIQSGSVYSAGFGAAAAYAAGLGGPLLQQFAPGFNALRPGGAAGPYCTSASEETGTGIFGGHSVCGPVPLNFDRSNNSNDAYTGEAIINSQFDGKFNFLVGGIYNKIHNSENSYYVNAFGLDYAAAVLGLAGTLGAQLGGNPAFPNSYRATPFYRNNTNDYRLNSYGIYGEAYFDLSSRLKLTGGIRYNNDKKEVSARKTLLSDINGTSVFLPYGSTNITQAVGYTSLDFDPSAGSQLYSVRKVGFGEVTGRAVLDWKVTDENLLYASYSRGYKSGGINPPLSSAFTVPETFNPEFIDSFEVGSKNTFLDGRLRLNLTGFYYKYKGLQLSRIVNQTSVNDNVNANIYGVEADAIVQPIRALAVNIGFSYLHTKVSDDKFLFNPRDPSGGRGDAVIIKDITSAANCAVVPTVAGNGAGANAYVGAINGSIGLRAPTTFPTGSGLAAGTTGAFGICSALRSNAATVGSLFGGVQVIDGGVAINIKGNQLPQAPMFKASTGVQYTLDFGNGMTLVPRFDLTFTGNSYGSIFNGEGPGQTRFVNRVPSYTIMNAQIQLNGRDDRYFIRGFIQNLSNNNAETGQYVTDQSSGLYTNIFTLEPRRYGVAAGVKF